MSKLTLEQIEEWRHLLIRNFTADDAITDVVNREELNALCDLAAEALRASEPVPVEPYFPEYLYKVATNTRIPTDFKKRQALCEMIRALEQPDSAPPADANESSGQTEHVLDSAASRESPAGDKVSVRDIDVGSAPAGPDAYEQAARIEQLCNELLGAETMQHWDRWRKEIEELPGASAPRDSFEAWLDSLVDAIRALASRPAGWIPVSERLPERSTRKKLNRVLVWFREDFIFGWLTVDGGWRVQGSNADWTDEIQRWHPLPAAPAPEEPRK